MILLFFLPVALSSNILLSNPVPARSHFIWNNAIVQELLKRGHNVTIIDGFADKAPKHPNYHPILMKGMVEHFWNQADKMEAMANIGPFETIDILEMYALGTCRYQLQHPDFKMLMDYPQQLFDVILIDITLGYCYLPLIQKFKYPPVVGLTAFLLPNHLSFDFGNHLHPGYLNWYGYKTNQPMSFFQRFWNHVYSYYEVYRMSTMKGKIEQIARELLGNGLDPFEIMEKHVSLLLCNVDPVLDTPQPLPPNIKAVGGLHARPPKKLPQDIEDILNNAKQGAIIFSLGTNVRPEYLPEDTIKVFLDAFKELQQTVIWKFAGNISDLPKNVYLKKWLPQNDILGHKNTVLFIGHGGAMSTQEAVYHGVPVLGVPFVADQHINVQVIKLQRRGDYVDILSITTEVLLEKLNKLLNDPIYRKNMKEASERIKSYPVSSVERAADWIEYSIRNNGTHFLNPKSRNLPFIVTSSLDILLFGFSVILLSIYFIMKLIKLIMTDQSKHKKD